MSAFKFKCWEVKWHPYLYPNGNLGLKMVDARSPRKVIEQISHEVTKVLPANTIAIKNNDDGSIMGICRRENILGERIRSVEGVSIFELNENGEEIFNGVDRWTS